MKAETGVRLVRGGLTGRIYAVTKWRSDPRRGPEAWEALDKIDVTEQYEQLRNAEEGYHVVQDEQAWMAGDVYDLVPSRIDPDAWLLRPLTNKASA